MMNETKLRAKKGQLNNLLSMLFVGGITIVVIVITIAIGAEITTDIRDGAAVAGVVQNVSIDGLSGLANLSGQLGLIGTVIALSVVLLILVVLLFRNFGGGIR